MKRAASKVLGWLVQAANRARTALEQEPAFAGIPRNSSRNSHAHPRDPRTFNLYSALVACTPEIVVRRPRGPFAKNTAKYFSARPSWSDHVHDLPAATQPVDSNGSFKRLQSGNLLLGLGTLGLGILLNVSEAKADSEPQVNSAPGNQLPLKRKLFQNLQDMFNLDPMQTDSKQQTEDAAPNTPSVTHKFERLVAGDKLVLREGDITPDQWQALSEFLESCPHIKSLRLQGMEITAKDVDELGKGLKQIRNIIFCDNSIGLHEGSLERLVALLLCCGFLESTSFIRNSLGDDHVPHILSLLRGHQSLTRISLSWNGVGDRGASAIANALHMLHNVTDIDLSYNCIGAYGKHLLREAGKARLQNVGPGVKAELNIHLRHNGRFTEFRREFKEGFPDLMKRRYKDNEMSRFKRNRPTLIRPLALMLPA